MKTKILLPFLLAAVLTLTACGPKAGPTPAGTLPPIGQPSATPLPAASDTPAPSGDNSNVVQVAIQGFNFSPAELTVKVGTTVTWTNDDSATHTVTADDGSWSSSRLSKGGTFSFTFDQAGTFSYHCAVHTSMQAKVIVTP